ncbi:hypothetical protein Ancab_035691 [Ancistrocladus abbreviatus]
MEVSPESTMETSKSEYNEQEGELGFHGSDDHSIESQLQDLSVQRTTNNEVEKQQEKEEDVTKEAKRHDQSDKLSCSSENNGDRDGERNNEKDDGVAVEEEEEEESEDEKREKEKASKNVWESKNEGEVSVMGKVEKTIRRSQYPVRLDAEDCSFFLRTGTCKFGMNCKFNHPPKWNNQAVKVKEKDGSLEKIGQANCKYYDRPGGCKFGSACRFNHIKKTPTAPLLELNFMGLPIRPGEKECPYYMRSGSCKYAANCRFHHPEPSALGGSDALSGYGNGGSITSESASPSSLAPWSSPAALSDSASYMPFVFPPRQGVPSTPEWNAYRKAPAFAPERNMHLPPAFGANNSAKTNIYTQQQMLIDEFPERPGQAECSYFLKTGDCKYRSACKFHHPKSRIPKSPSCAFSDLGLPLRPGQDICSYYSRYGICKFGPACKYDHPLNFARAAPLDASGPDQSSSFSSTVSNDAMLVGAGNGI